MRRLTEIEKSFIELNNLYSKLHYLNIGHIQALKKQNKAFYPTIEANNLIARCKELRKKIQADIKTHQEEMQNILNKGEADVELVQELSQTEEPETVEPQILIADILNGYFLNEAKKLISTAPNISLFEICKHQDPYKLRKIKNIELAFLNIEYQGVKSAVEIISDIRDAEGLGKTYRPIFALTHRKTVSTVMQKTLKRLNVTLLHKDEFVNSFTANLKLLKLGERQCD